MPVLEAKGLSKHYPGVVALDAVDLSLDRGEIRALLGENGAGKSTLVRLLSGAAAPSNGTIAVGGCEAAFASVAEASRAGIATVFQELHLLPDLSVAENLMLGREPTRSGFLSPRKRDEVARAALARLGLDLDPRRMTGTLSVAERQLVAVARATGESAKVLILDEPTSCLAPEEVSRLFEVMRRLATQGTAMIFVTHFLDQVHAITHSVSVLRNGRHVATERTADVTKERIVAWMLGREFTPRHSDRSTSETSTDTDDSTPPILVAEALGSRDLEGLVEIALRSGEIVGLGGLLGSGRSETARLLFGLDRRVRGRLAVDGAAVGNWSPRRAVRAGFAFAPEDRRHDGLLLELSIRDNILLSRRGAAGVLARRGQDEVLVERMIAALSIRSTSPSQRVAELSGGNQQKVLLARWLAMNPRLFILDEPTRGIDIGAKDEIRAIVRDVARRGAAVLLIASEPEELAADADRAIVLVDRRVAGEISKPIEVDALLALFAGRPR